VKLACYWWNTIPNFGDQLAPFLVENITNCKPEWTKEMSPRLLTVGSILTHALKNDIIWGSGMLIDHLPIAMPLDIRMVRGPLTAKYLAVHYSMEVDILGDPALLMQKYYEPKVSQCPGVTVIHHHADQVQYHGDRILDITMNAFQLIDEIVSSERIVTSALHPLIVAESYGIPVVAVKNKSEPGWYVSQQWKFKDYYASTGRRDYSLDHPDYQECLRQFGNIPQPVFPDRQRMIEAFPWDRLDDLMISEA